MKKPRVAFTIADSKNKEYAVKMINSLRKFHSEEELPIIVYGPETIQKYITDQHFFYRATPLFAKDLINEYELVLKLDCDQIIMGKLDRVFEKDYDVGTVLNINRVDPRKYGMVNVFDIYPQEYYNCGFVAMRSKAFIDHWWRLCNSYHFFNLRYREQDILNLICHYGDYKVVCFDRYDNIRNYSAWHGIVFKGEELHAMLKDGKVIVPVGMDKYPDKEITVKAWHTAGGDYEKKINYKIYFTEEMIDYIDWLVSDSKEPYGKKSVSTNA